MITLQFVAFLLLALPNNVATYASHAGSCRSGTAIGGSHAGDDTGPLSKAGYQVAIDDVILLPNHDTTDIAAVKNVTAGQKHSLSLRDVADDDGGFRGFLIRAVGSSGTDDDGADASRSLGILNGDDEVQEADGCDATAAGITHTNGRRKRSVSAIITAPCGVSKLLLEVTMVKENKNMGDNDGWYYDNYTLNVDRGNCTVTTPVDDISVEGSATSGGTCARLMMSSFITGILSLFW